MTTNNDDNDTNKMMIKKKKKDDNHDGSSSSEEIEEPSTTTTTTTTSSPVKKKSPSGRLSSSSSSVGEEETTTAGGGSSTYGDGGGGDDDSNELSTSKPEPQNLASVRDVFSYGDRWVKAVCLPLGLIFAAIAGAVAPTMIFVFARSFETLVAPPSSPEFMDTVKEMTYIFMGLGVVAFGALCGYATLLETSAGNMTKDFKQQWFRALIRQDMAYFDIQDVTGIATLISTNGARYKRYVEGEKMYHYILLIG